MKAKKTVKFRVGAEERAHECWIADITDPCIVGLDLLQSWGARVDVTSNTIQLGTETRGLQLGREKRSTARVRRGARHREYTPPRDVEGGAATSALLVDSALSGQQACAAPVRREAGRLAPLSPEEHQHSTGTPQVSKRRSGTKSALRRKNEPRQAYCASQMDRGLADSAPRRRSAEGEQVMSPASTARRPQHRSGERSVRMPPLPTARPMPSTPLLAPRAPGTRGPPIERPSGGGGLFSSGQDSSPMPPETADVLRGLCAKSRPDLTRPQEELLHALLWEYWDVFAVKDQDRGRTGLVQHNIDTGDARPIRVPPRRMAIARRAEAEKMIGEMSRAGVIEPSHGPWVAPAVLVTKRTVP